MSSCGTVRLVPGPRGLPGVDGTDGTDGISAFTLVDAQFVMPAELATVGVTVVDSSWMTPGMLVYVQNAGWMEVTAIGSSTGITLKNLEDTANDAYLSNVAPGTVVAVSNKIVAAGLQGPAGTDGVSGAPVDATYITSTPNGTLSSETALSTLATGFLHSTTGTGVLAVYTEGIANNNIATVDQVAGMTAGQAVFATASGIESKTAAAARTALGITTGVLNTNYVLVDDASNLTNGQILRATAAGIESVTNATIQSQLGIGVRAIRTELANYTATPTDDVILCDATAGNMTIQLPPAASSSNKSYVVVKIDVSANTVTVDGDTGDLIDGAATQVINSQWTAIEIICNGTAWYII